VKLTSEQIEHARKLIDKGEGRQYVAASLTLAVRRYTGRLPSAVLHFSAEKLFGNLRKSELH
jgi:hypothetical protein